MYNNRDFYNKNSMEIGFFKRKYIILKKLIEPQKTILDLGCYDGRIGDSLTKELNCIVDGADISDLNINKSKALRNKYVLDLNDKCWPINDKYDYVLFTDIIEHIFDTDQFMINVSKLVKDGGYIIYSTPNIASVGRRLTLLFGKNPYIEVSKHKEVNLFNVPVVGHIRYFTLGTMKSLANFYGFEIVKITPTSLNGFYSNRLIEKLFPGLCWHLFIKAKKR